MRILPTVAAGDGARVQAQLQRDAAAIARWAYHVWRVLIAGGLAGRPLEPAAVQARRRRRDQPLHAAARVCHTHCIDDMASACSMAVVAHVYRATGDFK